MNQRKLTASFLEIPEEKDCFGVEKAWLRNRLVSCGSTTGSKSLCSHSRAAGTVVFVSSRRGCACACVVIVVVVVVAVVAAVVVVVVVDGVCSSTTQYSPTRVLGSWQAVTPFRAVGLPLINAVVWSSFVIRA